MVKRAVLAFSAFFIASVFLNSSCLQAKELTDDEFFDMIERRAFDYFWREASPRTGLIKNTTEEHAPASTAAVGFGLSAIPVGIERGWISRGAGYKRVLRTLKTFRDKAEDNEGFFYHYLNIHTGERAWESEVSIIDSAILFAGMITAGEYFKGTEAESIARDIYERANWTSYTCRGKILQLGWRPEGGFEPPMASFSESILPYLLALGSPTYTLPKESWQLIYRPIGRYKGNDIIFSFDGSLFTYLFPLVWFDLRDKHDAFADYFQNAKNAILANRQFSIDNKDKFKAYSEKVWGISASLSPADEGYAVYGARPGAAHHDGTVAPYVVAGSIPIVPDIAIPSYRYIYEKYRKKIWGRYGITDAFNIDKNWWSKDYISIDQGLTLLALENYRSGLIWKYFMRSPYARAALRRAGFAEGAQVQVKHPQFTPGNPGDEIAAEKLKRRISIDGDISDWDGVPSISLSSLKRRNVEQYAGCIVDDIDLSGTFHIGWDERYFYIAGEVTDDKIVTTEKDGLIYRDDLVEVFFDTDMNGFFFDKNSHDYQWGFAPARYARRRPMMWSWGPLQAYPKSTKYAYRLTEGGYVIEAAIPLKELRPLKIEEGTEILFGLSIHDRDGRNKEGKMTWSIDLESAPGTILFGRLKFQGENPLDFKNAGAILNSPVQKEPK